MASKKRSSNDPLVCGREKHEFFELGDFQTGPQRVAIDHGGVGGGGGFAWTAELARSQPTSHPQNTLSLCLFPRAPFARALYEPPHSFITSVNVNLSVFVGLSASDCSFVFFIMTFLPFFHTLWFSCIFFFLRNYFISFFTSHSNLKSRRRTFIGKISPLLINL